jgi:iron(III) transport system substrate-binding protein
MAFISACVWSAESSVVVYTALDRDFSEPILQDFERQTGITVKCVFDTESTKTVGLVNRIRAERQRPRCDVFWNNEIVNTLRLKEEGLLQPCHPPAARDYPAHFQDPQGYWFGFAARARVLIVNNDLVEVGSEPASILELAVPLWRGRVGIAKPLFGTTASHVACLFAHLGEEPAVRLLDGLKTNDVQVLSGNKGCAQAVAAGRLACALTDTDDAIIEVDAGKPVRIVYLDTAADQMGTLFIPNTLAVVQGCKNPESAGRLIDFLLSPAVEARLARGPSAQIPLNPKCQAAARVQGPNDIRAMKVDLSKAAKAFASAAKYVEQRFLK